MLSKKTIYAIRALVALGKLGNNIPIQIGKISEKEHIPKKFLEQILLDLRRAGYLNSKKGVGGGYSLLKTPDQILLSDIIRITNGPIALLPCVSLNYYQKCEECAHEETCGLHGVFVDVRDATLKILTETSIADLILREQKGNAIL